MEVEGEDRDIFKGEWGTVVVNFMYLLGWAMVPRYSVEHCSGLSMKVFFV